MRAATAFYGFFSTKCWKNTVLLRVGLQCYFDLTIFWGITGKNNILPKKLIITEFPKMTKMTRTFCVFGFPGMYVCMFQMKPKKAAKLKHAKATQKFAKFCCSPCAGTRACRLKASLNSLLPCPYPATWESKPLKFWGLWCVLLHYKWHSLFIRK